MSFQAYLNNVQTKTGKSAADFRTLAEAKGFAGPEGLKPGIKATMITDWLKQEFGLGHGHAMALVTLFKGAKREGDH